MRAKSASLIAFGCLLGWVSPATAGSLQVSPVLAEVVAPGAATVMSLANKGDQPSTVQLRVYRWEQSAGADRMVETTDVVASPPLLTVQPGATNVVRLVRVSRAPVKTEESYRLLVDEVPRTDRQNGFGVKIALRYSIPVFFTPREGNPPAVQWTLERKGSEVIVNAINTGSRRVRLANLSLKGQGGTSTFGTGLAGYVLGSSANQWAIKNDTLKPGSKVEITALTEHGPIVAEATLRARQ